MKLMKLMKLMMIKVIICQDKQFQLNNKIK